MNSGKSSHKPVVHLWGPNIDTKHVVAPADPPEGTRLTSSPSPALQGDAVTFTCAVTGALPRVDKYGFHFNSSSGWVLKKETNDGRYTINNVQGSDQGTYQCVPSNDAGPGTNSTSWLTVNGTFVLGVVIVLCVLFLVFSIRGPMRRMCL